MAAARPDPLFDQTASSDRAWREPPRRRVRRCGGSPARAPLAKFAATDAITHARRGWRNHNHRDRDAEKQFLHDTLSHDAPVPAGRERSPSMRGCQQRCVIRAILTEVESPRRQLQLPTHVIACLATLDQPPPFHVLVFARHRVALGIVGMQASPVDRRCSCIRCRQWRQSALGDLPAWHIPRVSWPARSG